MKVLYIVLILVSLIIIAMLVLSFFYLDLQQHQSFLYALYYDNVLTGYEKLDRYILENKVIYKSATELPRDILCRKTVRKIAFDMRGKNFIDYKKEILSNGAKSLVYILNSACKTSFMATGHANFSYLDKVATYGNAVPFEDTSLVTYPPLIRRYNFKKGGEQFVNVLAPVSVFLPPVRDIISIISVGRDTIEIEGKKVNCERLVLESKNGELISVWVSRAFHNLLMVNIPKYGFEAVFCTKKKDIPVEEYKKESNLYTERNVIFTSEDIALHGTFSVPNSGKGTYPAVMLIWGSGPLDRNALGIFADIAHGLAEAGYCVLRFDKRGIGQSGGFFSAYAQPEEISDLKSAVNFLKSRSEVDKSRIALLGQSEGGFYATYLAGSEENIGACIILSALSSLSPLANDCGKLKNFIKNIAPDDNEYFEKAIAATRQNRKMIKDKSDWITILGERVFIKKMRFENKYNPLETIKKVNVPVLILHGRKNDINLLEETEELGKALTEEGNDNFTIIYFGELGHFLGKMVKNPPLREHIELDAEVLKSIIAWLDKNLPALPVKPSPATESIESGESHEIAAEEGGANNQGIPAE